MSKSLSSAQLSEIIEITRRWLLELADRANGYEEPPIGSHPGDVGFALEQAATPSELRLLRRKLSRFGAAKIGSRSGS